MGCFEGWQGELRRIVSALLQEGTALMVASAASTDHLSKVMYDTCIEVPYGTLICDLQDVILQEPVKHPWAGAV